MEVTFSVKHSSLLQYGIDYDHKSFVKLWTDILKNDLKTFYNHNLGALYCKSNEAF